MLVDCPCGEMYSRLSHCPKCGSRARIEHTDEAHDHHPTPEEEEEEEE